MAKAPQKLPSERTQEIHRIINTGLFSVHQIAERFNISVGRVGELKRSIRFVRSPLEQKALNALLAIQRMATGRQITHADYMEILHLLKSTIHCLETGRYWCSSGTHFHRGCACPKEIE